MIEKEFDLYIHGSRIHAKSIQPVNSGLTGSAITLVLLHEGLGSIAHWKHFPQKICRNTGCECLIYDRSGYGKSEPLKSSRPLNYLHREAVDILPAVLDQAKVANPILIGHSDGGTIALLYAAAFPEKVRGVITEAAHVFVEEITLRGIEASLKVFEEDEKLKSRLAEYQGGHTDSILSDWKNIWLNPKFRDWNIEEMLPQIKCPVLVIQGEEDEYGSVAQVEAIANQVSGPSKKLVIPGCGHRPHHQAEEVVLREMSGFITDILR